MVTQLTDPHLAASFFRDLYPDDVPKGLGLILWGGRGIQPIRTTSIDEAVAGTVELASRGAEGYYGVALQDLEAMDAEAIRRRESGASKVGPQWTRGFAATAAAIPGVWLDIDIDDEGRGKEGLPKTIEDVDRILAPLPAPTFQALTGGGVHAYWLFREPWVFDGPEERGEAEDLLRRWHAWGSAQGFTVDQANDLARVLRVVGGWSAKRARRVSFRDRVAEGVRYNPSELLEAVQTLGPRLRPRRIAASGFAPANGHKGNGSAHEPAAALPGIQGPLRPVLPSSELMAALEEIPGFLPLWEGKVGAKSASEADWFLARMGAQAGLDDEQIYGLMVAWATKHGRDQKKLERADYVAGTIGKARALVQAEQAREQELDQAVEVLLQAAAAADSRRQAELAVARGEPPPPVLPSPPAAAIDQGRANLAEELTQELGIPLERIVRHQARERSSFVAYVGGKPCPLGGIQGLMDQAAFRNAIAASTLRVISGVSKEDWPKVRQRLVALTQDDDVGEVSDPEGAILTHVDNYLSACPGLDMPFEHEKRGERMLAGDPFRRDGQTWFSLGGFAAYLRGAGLGYDLTSVAPVLRRAGATPRKFKAPGTGKSRWFWSVPDLTEAHDPGDSNPSIEGGGAVEESK